MPSGPPRSVTPIRPWDRCSGRAATHRHSSQTVPSSKVTSAAVRSNPTGTTPDAALVVAAATLLATVVGDGRHRHARCRHGAVRSTALGSTDSVRRRVGVRVTATCHEQQCQRQPPSHRLHGRRYRQRDVRHPGARPSLRRGRTDVRELWCPRRPALPGAPAVHHAGRVGHPGAPADARRDRALVLLVLHPLPPPAGRPGVISAPRRAARAAGGASGTARRPPPRTPTAPRDGG